MPLTIYPTEHRAEDFGLSPGEIQLLWRMEERHFWHRARNRWIAKALQAAGVLPPATVLEVGCGSGAVAGYLQACGYQVTGVDTATPLVEKAHQRCPEAAFIAGDVAQVDTGPFAAIGLFDVIEHLSDPSGMLASCLGHARPGTVIVATVPAQGALHTVIDDLSGHKRRYETGELAALFASAGLVGIEERGIFRATVPMQKALRRHARGQDASRLSDEERHALWVANFRIPPAPLNLAMDALCALERAFGFAGALNRDGASLLATARVPG